MGFYIAAHTCKRLERRSSGSAWLRRKEVPTVPLPGGIRGFFPHALLAGATTDSEDCHATCDEEWREWDCPADDNFAPNSPWLQETQRGSQAKPGVSSLLEPEEPPRQPVIQQDEA